MTSLIKQIESRMRQHNLSIAELERRAGLKIHAVRNILKARIKRPSAETLFAVARVLECSILDLLEVTDKNEALIDIPKLEIKVEDLEIMEQSIKAATAYIKGKKMKVTLEVFLQACSKIYRYSTSEEPRVVDPKFV